MATRRPFEAVALQFVNADQPDALCHYLLSKLSSDSIGAGDAAQRTMLCTWVAEMLLSKMNSLEDASNEEGLAETVAAFQVRSCVCTWRVCARSLPAQTVCNLRGCVFWVILGGVQYPCTRSF